MHGLTAHAQRLGDGLPTPAQLPGIGDMHRLQLLLKTLQRAHRTQSDGGVGAIQVGVITHAVKLT